MICDEGLTVEGEDDVLTFTDIWQQCGSLKTVVVEAQCIHEDIAHHIGLRVTGLFAVSNTRRAHTCREEIVAEGVDHETVDFLWHVNIKGTCTCNEMGQTDSPFLGDDSRRHRGGEVVDDDHHIDGMIIEEAVEGSHHLTGNLIQTGRRNT